MVDSIAPTNNPIAVIVETSLTSEAYDEAWGGGGHFWLQEHGLLMLGVIRKSGLAKVGLKIFEYQRAGYDGEDAMAFKAFVKSAPSGLFSVDEVVVGTMWRPEFGDTFQGFIYRNV